MYVNFFNADSSTIKMWKTTHNNRGDELSSSPGQGEHGQAGERQRAKRMNMVIRLPRLVAVVLQVPLNFKGEK